MILFTGLVIGFTIAAPVGPIGVLCIRRTLASGRATGLASGLGAATADAIYGTIGALGITAISGPLTGHQMWLRLIGGLFLCYLGVRSFISRPAERAAGRDGSGIIPAYLSTLFLTLTNPVTIIYFAAVFAGLGVAASGGSYASAALVVAGVFAGSALWWLTLSTGVSILRERIGPRSLWWMNKLSGVVIGGFGLAAVIGTIR